MKLGVIADDVTGGTDLASVLRQVGLAVVQTIGIPAAPVQAADAVVISLKTRTAPAGAAADAAAAAASFLQRHGAAQLYFKYCSTFDSTEAGNIGPVIERLLDHLGAPFTIACPAYPGLGRSVYLGHLFVGDRLLSESSMRNHPLTPMTDPDLVRVAARQVRSPVGLVALSVVEQGAAATRRRFDELAGDGYRLAIADAVLDRHLETLGAACADLPLVTGAAGLGRALALQSAAARASESHQLPRSAHARRGRRWGSGPSAMKKGGAPRAVKKRTSESAAPDPCGSLHAGSPAAVLSGSCSAATQAQVRRLAETLPSRCIDPMALTRDERVLPDLIDWACETVRGGGILVYSTAAAETVRDVQRQLGAAAAAALVESAFRSLAAALARSGVRTFVVAGGETAGAVLEALGIRALGFGAEIEPGVPWTSTLDPPGFRLALKSGNFGGVDFFAKALGRPV
jgi:uncharacterized protein YgbK (DUF1537 family)